MVRVLFGDILEIKKKDFWVIGDIRYMGKKKILKTNIVRTFKIFGLWILKQFWRYRRFRKSWGLGILRKYRQFGRLEGLGNLRNKIMLTTFIVWKTCEIWETLSI